MKNIFLFGLTIFMLTCFLTIHLPTAQKSETPFPRPDSHTIETRLWERINQERKKRELPPLNLSSELTLLARGHSKHMAEVQTLTPLSMSGESYRQRLIKNGGYFVKIGENITFSETFQDEFIHQQMMESPEISENTMDPDFDQVGIGVVFRESRGYYITMDFCQSLRILDPAEVTYQIQDKINAIRKANRLTPLVFSPEAGLAAGDFSMKKALGQPLPDVADEFGETLIHFLITPQPDRLNNLEEKISGIIYGEAGVGIWFGKNDSYPGGAYFISLFLFPRSQYDEALDEDVAKMVLEEINSRRRERGLPALKWDSRLAKEAKKTSVLLRSQAHRESASQVEVRPKMFYNFILQRRTLTYISEDPRIWPENIGEKIMDTYIKRIGIGVSFKIDSKSRRETFWISIITLN